MSDLVSTLFMLHIHTQPGHIDSIAEVFCVFQGKVLFRLHEKYGIWIAPGGHIELDETPEGAAVREVKEEIGLDVVLWDASRPDGFPECPSVLSGCQELIVPAFMNIHSINSEHRHIAFVYFGTVKTNEIVEPDNHEKAATRWLTAEQIRSDAAIDSLMKKYALAALRVLAR